MSNLANPEHRNVKDSMKKPVLMWTNTPKLRNVRTPRRNGNNRLFLSVLRRAEKHYLRNVKFFSDEDGIRLNTNILQGSSANIVGTEPIFVSNAELYSRKHLIINTLHFTQLPQGRLGLWVRAPSGSLKQKAKQWKPLIINHYQRFFFLSIPQIEAEYRILLEVK